MEPRLIRRQGLKAGGILEGEKGVGSAGRMEEWWDQRKGGREKLERNELLSWRPRVMRFLLFTSLDTRSPPAVSILCFLICLVCSFRVAPSILGLRSHRLETQYFLLSRRVCSDCFFRSFIRWTFLYFCFVMRFSEWEFSHSDEE